MLTDKRNRDQESTSEELEEQEDHMLEVQLKKAFGRSEAVNKLEIGETASLLLDREFENKIFDQPWRSSRSKVGWRAKLPMFHPDSTFLCGVGGDER